MGLKQLRSLLLLQKFAHVSYLIPWYLGRLHMTKIFFYSAHFFAPLSGVVSFGASAAPGAAAAISACFCFINRSEYE